MPGGPYLPAFELRRDLLVGDQVLQQDCNARAQEGTFSAGKHVRAWGESFQRQVEGGANCRKGCTAAVASTKAPSYSLIAKGTCTAKQSMW